MSEESPNRPHETLPGLSWVAAAVSENGPWGSWQHIGRVAWRLTILSLKVIAVLLALFGLAYYFDSRNNIRGVFIVLASAFAAVALLFVRVMLRTQYPEARLGHILGLRPLRTGEHIDREGNGLVVTFQMGPTCCMQCKTRSVGMIMSRPRLWFAIHTTGILLLLSALLAVVILITRMTKIPRGVVHSLVYVGFFGGLGMFSTEKLVAAGFCTACGDYTRSLGKRRRANEKKVYLRWREPRIVRRARTALDRRHIKRVLRVGFVAWLALALVHAVMSLGGSFDEGPFGGLPQPVQAALLGAIMATAMLGLWIVAYGGIRWLSPLTCRMTGNGLSWVLADKSGIILYERIRHCAISSRTIDDRTVSILALTLEQGGAPGIIGIAPTVSLEELRTVLENHRVSVDGDTN